MINIEDRLQGKYIVQDTGCWHWTAAVGGSKSKRPQIRINWKLYYAGRVMWELKKGPIPAGVLLCHKCSDELCINPDHMFLGTQKENMRDASRKGRFSGRRLMNEGIVKVIVSLRNSGFTQGAISQETGLPIGTVGAILVGNRWS